MSDLEDNIRALPRTEPPHGWEHAPVADDWRLRGFADTDSIHLDGIVATTEPIEARASGRIVAIDAAKQWVRTEIAVYRLGWCHHRLPPAIRVVKARDWQSAWCEAMTITDSHTLPNWVWSAVIAAGDQISGWQAKRQAAAAVGEYLGAVGRWRLARPWWLLATDGSQQSAIRNAHEILVGVLDTDKSDEGRAAVAAWEKLAAAPVPVEPDDTVRNAWKLYNADAINRLRGDGVLAEVFVEDKEEAATAGIGWRAHDVPDEPEIPLVIRILETSWTWREAAQMLLDASPVEVRAIAEVRGLMNAEGAARIAIANEMKLDRWEAGKHDEAHAWKLLATDPNNRGERGAIKTMLELASVGHKVSGAVTAWQIFADDPNDASNPNDPVGSAWRSYGRETLKVEIKKTLEPKSPAPDHQTGIIVIREIGGAQESTHAKEAARAFKALVGQRIPLTTTPDLAAVRTALHAEFPHLISQINILLSDLAAGEPIRLRNTLLVGEPGGGKTRLVRRLTAALRIGLHRFDGAGSSDSTFAGCPRHWSSAEHSVPLEAIRRYKIANPILLVDEIDKSSRGSHNGSLTDALMPFLESESAGVYPDPYVQSDVDLSRVSYLLTANDDTKLPSPLRDRLRVIKLPLPTVDHLPALARCIVDDLAAEAGGDRRWFADLNDGELAVAEGLWTTGSVRRLRAIVERIVAYREQRPRH